MSRPKRKRHYVGIRNGFAGRREVFTVNFTPTADIYGHTYHQVVGPFRTKTGAELVRDGKAHTVAEAERIVNRVRTLAQYR